MFRLDSIGSNVSPYIVVIAVSACTMVCTTLQYYARCQFHDVSESHKAVNEAIDQYLTSS